MYVQPTRYSPALPDITREKEMALRLPTQCAHFSAQVKQYLQVSTKGQNATAFFFLSASFTGPSPHYVCTIATWNLHLLQLLKRQLKHLIRARMNLSRLIHLCHAKEIPVQSHLYSVNKVLLMSWFYVALAVRYPVQEDYVLQPKPNRSLNKGIDVHCLLWRERISRVQHFDGSSIRV